VLLHGGVYVNEVYSVTGTLFTQLLVQLGDVRVGLLFYITYSRLTPFFSRQPSLYPYFCLAPPTQLAYS
jgi:hypothetical protein